MVFPGGNDQVRLWRLVINEESQGLIDRLGSDRVVVIQDEQKVLRDGGNLVEQGGQKGFDLQRLGRLEHSQHRFSKIRCNCLQSSDEVSQKAGGVVITLIQ